jgi:SAM-dependent methyltransferase
MRSFDGSSGSFCVLKKEPDMNELELLIDFHKEAERQGPGSVKDTKRALEWMGISRKKNLRIADVGCGTGGQTITLAQHTGGQITAVDLFPDFLEELNKRGRRLGLEDKIESVTASMEDLPFEKEALDVIWSEGAIYNMGFEAGIKTWKDYLRTGGYLAVSEITWITHKRPTEIEAYWNENYPEIDTASGKIHLLEKYGYILVGYFVLSPDSWIKGYYKPMEERFADFLEKHKHSSLAQKVVEDHQREMIQYHRFKEYYSYGFYLAQKVKENPR